MTHDPALKPLIERARQVDILKLAEREFRAKLKKAGAAEWVGSCPACGGTDRFSINTSKRIFNCRNCQAGGDAISLMRLVRGSSFVEALEFLTGQAITRKPSHDTANGRGENSPNVLESASGSNGAEAAGGKFSPPGRSTTPVAAALNLWREGLSPRETLAEAYLRSRSLELDDDVAGEVLRWHAGIGALLALFRDVRTDEPRAISRTYLDREGRKIGRKFLGPVGGAAVKLDPDDAVLEGLHIGEGVETCMAARQLGLRPTWALGSAGAIAAFPVLAGIECLTLLAEHDEASARAIEACGGRWYAAGREVLINQADFGKDLNDELREGGAWPR
jgi:hypothetical protein